MKASDKLRSSIGGNIADSIATNRQVGSSIVPPGALANPFAGLQKIKGAVVLPLDRIAPDPTQPREEFEPEGLRLLADSMRTRGQLQPIRVRWDAARGIFSLLCGERRWRAARLAGMAELSCVVHEGELGPNDKLLIQLTENALREDLKPIEQAKAYRSLMETMGLSQRGLAEELHLDQAKISRAVALLQLPERVQEQVEQGVIAPAIAYEISKEPPELQPELVAAAIKQGITRDHIRVSRKARESGRRKVTSQVIKTRGGPKVTIEWGRGLTPALVRQALREALSQVEEAEAA